jgi:branched-chain amino acid transport system substrate-binding protein
MYKKYSVAMGAALAVGLAGVAGSAVAKVEGDTIILGSAISLSGKYSTNGLHTQKGYDFAAKKINDAGGVKVGGKTYKLAIKYYDDESAASRATQLAERLIQQDGIEFMLGPYSTGMTKAVAPVTEKFKVPMVEAEGASRALFTQGYKYMFAVLSTSEYYLAPVLDLVADRAKAGWKAPSDLRIGMAFENDGFSLDVRAGVLDVAKKYNMKIVIDDKLPADLSDMSATLTKFKALKPDVLLVSGHSKGAATAARQIEEMKVQAPVIAITHCEAAKVHVKFPKAANGILCPTQWLTNLPNNEPIFGDAANYDKEFKAAYPEYKTGIPYQTTQASAAVLVFKDAFERANSFDRDAVRDALAATDMDSFYGPIKFAPEGNNIAKPMYYRQINASGGYDNVVTHKDIIMPRKADY